MLYPQQPSQWLVRGVCPVEVGRHQLIVNASFIFPIGPFTYKILQVENFPFFNLYQGFLIWKEQRIFMTIIHDNICNTNIILSKGLPLKIHQKERMVTFSVMCWVPWNADISSVCASRSSVRGLENTLQGRPEPWVLPFFWHVSDPWQIFVEWNEWPSLGLSFFQNEGKEKTRLHPSLLSAPMFYDSDLITDRATQKEMYNCLSLERWLIHEFSHGVSMLKKNLYHFYFCFPK